MADIQGGRQRVLVGHGDERGTLLAFDFDAATGGLTRAGETATGSSTSYLAAHPGGRYLYLTHNRTNQLSAFRVNATGALEPINQVDVPAAPGEPAAGPAHVAVDARGRFLLAANYRGHNAVVFALGDDGAIGPLAASVADGKHAHSIRLTTEDRFALVPYLGSDRVGQYRFDRETGALISNQPAAATTPGGAGPRHLEFHPRFHVVYLLGELDAHLYMYALDAAGCLTERGRLDTLPGGYTGRRWAAHLQADPAGRFLYVSNRAHDSLAVFALDPDPHVPALIERQSSGGQTPRHFSLSPDGRFLLVAHQDSNDLVSFAVDPATGGLRRQDRLPVGTSPYYVNFVTLPPSA